jgi:hypothetical protein
MSSVSTYLSRKLIDKQKPLLVLILDGKGQGTYQNMTTAGLYSLILDKISEIDSRLDRMQTSDKSTLAQEESTM